MARTRRILSLVTALAALNACALADRPSAQLVPEGVKATSQEAPATDEAAEPAGSDTVLFSAPTSAPAATATPSAKAAPPSDQLAALFSSDAAGSTRGFNGAGGLAGTGTGTGGGGAGLGAGGLVTTHGRGSAFAGKADGLTIPAPQVAPERELRQRADKKEESKSKSVDGPAPKDSVAIGDGEDIDGSTREGGAYESAGVNPLVDPKVDRLSTFAIDVDTGSYTLSKRYLAAGSLPAAAGVRVEEWVNAFHYDYKDDSSVHPFSIHMEGAPLAKQSQLLRIGIQGKRIEKAERAPVALTFLVDVSGSMSGPDRLPLAKDALQMLVAELNGKDSVSLVTYAGSTEVRLPSTPVTAANKSKILSAIQNLTNGGGTNMGSGMELAYQEATKALSNHGISRVIVLSDGDANIGRTGYAEMLSSIKGYVSEGVTMSTVGFGTGNYRDDNMERLADAGNGNYSYIGSRSDAKKVFVDDLTGTLQVIAKDVKIQVEMNPAVVKSYRLIGYENRDVADRDFRNDKVDAGEIGAGHTVTALYEVQLQDAFENGLVNDDIATVRVRYKQPKGDKATEVSSVFTKSALLTDVHQLDADGRFAAGIGLAAEAFRNSAHMQRLGLNLAFAEELMQSALTGPHADERREIAALVAPFAGATPVASR